jgi:hypothetical protein
MGRTIRSLAAEAGLSVDECLTRLRGAGVGVGVGRQRLDGEDLAAALRALAPARAGGRPPAEAARAARRELDAEEMVVRLLRPLREKGKVGSEHTTPIENLWAHGFPDHRKADARDLTEALLHDGALAEKESQGRRHVWLTNVGRARLGRAEEALAGR